jgi:hypothetical protein
MHSKKPHVLGAITTQRLSAAESYPLDSSIYLDISVPPARADSNRRGRIPWGVKLLLAEKRCSGGRGHKTPRRQHGRTPFRYKPAPLDEGARPHRDVDIQEALQTGNLKELD